VLQPVRRRRRQRRIVWRRLSPVAALGLASAAAGLYVGAQRAPQLPDAGPAPAAAATQAARVVRPVAPLVTGPALVTTALPAVTAPAAILVDADTGRVLWERAAHERRPIASTTKIMTALLALRKLGPQDRVTVPAEAPRVPLVREGLRAGEQVEAWKLFYGALLYSGNDSALTLAVGAGGTRSKFVHAMNAEAKRLGLHDSHFRSPSGVLDEDNYSSVWDLAALTRMAMRNARFRAIVRTKRREVPWAAPTYAKVYVNNNKLLRLYPGANGVKTGYTHKAGNCLVASATRGGHSLIAVVLASKDMYGDAKRLLDLGFETL